MATTRLTKTLIDSLDEDGFTWDSELVNFGLRVSGQTKTYIVQSRINGRTKRIKVGRHGTLTLIEARQLGRKILVQMSEGIDPKEEKRLRAEQGISLGALFADFLKRRHSTRTKYDYESYMRRYFHDWVSKPITTINMEMIEQRHQHIGIEHGGAQANVSMRFIRAMFNYAMGVYTRKNGEPLLNTNPVNRLNAKKLWFQNKRREDYIEEHQLHRWYKSTVTLESTTDIGSAVIRDYLLFILFTGLRRTEASLIKWEHVDFEGKKLLLPSENVKNKTNFHIPLTTFTLALLRQRERESETSEYVFPGSGKSGHIVEPKYVMAKIAASSGITFSLHGLRRSYATYASSVIDNAWTVKRLMNHLTGQDITQSYMQGVERLRKPAQEVTDYILKLTEGELTLKSQSI